MRKQLTVIPPFLAMALGLLFLLGLGLPGLRAAEQEVAGRYKIYDWGIRFTITVPDPPPAAAIIVLHLPPDVTVDEATPPVGSHDRGTGEVKWLPPDISPGRLHLKLNLSRRVGKEEVRSEVLFRDVSGGSSSYALKPIDVKRAAIEGC